MSLPAFMNSSPVRPAASIPVACAIGSRYGLAACLSPSHMEVSEVSGSLNGLRPSIPAAPKSSGDRAPVDCISDPSWLRTCPPTDATQLAPSWTAFQVWFRAS